MPTVTFETPDGTDEIVTWHYKWTENALLVWHYPDAPDWAKEEPDADYVEQKTEIPKGRVVRIDEEQY